MYHYASGVRRLEHGANSLRALALPLVQQLLEMVLDVVIETARQMVLSGFNIHAAVTLDGAAQDSKASRKMWDETNQTLAKLHARTSAVAMTVSVRVSGMFCFIG